jgi:hypothetical protein
VASAETANESSRPVAVTRDRRLPGGHWLLGLRTALHFPAPVADPGTFDDASLGISLPEGGYSLSLCRSPDPRAQ